MSLGRTQSCVVTGQHIFASQYRWFKESSESWRFTSCSLFTSNHMIKPEYVVLRVTEYCRRDGFFQNKLPFPPPCLQSRLTIKRFSIWLASPLRNCSTVIDSSKTGVICTEQEKFNLGRSPGMFRHNSFNRNARQGLFTSS